MNASPRAGGTLREMSEHGAALSFVTGTGTAVLPKTRGSRATYMYSLLIKAPGYPAARTQWVHWGLRAPFPARCGLRLQADERALDYVVPTTGANMLHYLFLYKQQSNLPSQFW